jgi:hypothetical protein
MHQDIVVLSDVVTLAWKQDCRLLMIVGESHTSELTFTRVGLTWLLNPRTKHSRSTLWFAETLALLAVTTLPSTPYQLICGWQFHPSVDCLIGQFDG